MVDELAELFYWISSKEEELKYASMDFQRQNPEEKDGGEGICSQMETSLATGEGCGLPRFPAQGRRFNVVDC